MGYSVLAITDHEATYDHRDLSTLDFLLLTGYEAYIRPSERCKYMPKGVAEARKKAGISGPRQYNPQYINQFIKSANESGYLVSYNHPCWSMEAESDVLSYEGLFSLEIYNTGCTRGNGYEHDVALFDKFQRRGKFLYCHGSDDNHNGLPLDDPQSDSFGSWTMIMAQELTYPAVIEALEKCDFYASTGPEILELYITRIQVR